MAPRSLGCAFAVACAIAPSSASAQAPPAKAPRAPALLPGEALVIAGTDGVAHGYGEAKAERPMGSLARLVWLKFEGVDWAARGVAFKCKGTLEGVPCTLAKGHGRVDLESAVRGDCTLAFRAWIAESAEGWRRDYGEGVARARLEDAFRPFLGARLGRGEALPNLDGAWTGEGELLRTSPERFMDWLNDPEQAELLSRCRRTLGSQGFHFKDLANLEDWWFQSGGAPGGGWWTVGGNGEVVGVLWMPVAKSSAEGIARFRALMGIRKK